MKNFTFIVLFFSFVNFAQVGVNTPNPGATLDITATNPTGITTNVDGFIIPRVTRERAQSMLLTPTGTQIFISEVVTGTASGTTVDVTTIGFYFYNGSKWQAVGTDKNWSLNGNTGTNSSTNYLGTTDAIDLKINTAAIERIRILSGGQIAVNTPAAPASSDLLTITTNTTNNRGLVSNNSIASGVGVFGFNSGAGGRGVTGSTSDGTSIGIRAINSFATGSAILANGSGSGAFTFAAGSGATINGTTYGTISLGNDATSGWGIATLGNNLGSISTITGGGGGSFNGNQWGVYANAAISGSGTTDRAAFIGNFNETSTPRTVYVGARIGSVNYKILGTGAGSVSTTMSTRTGERILFAPEAPENWFFDIGEVTLTNGKATVILDPIFVDCIADSKPFKVFVQGGENTIGSIRITRNQIEKTFVVEDLGGPSAGTVQYSIYGIWKQKENLRFPEYHQPFTITEMKKTELDRKF